MALDITSYARLRPYLYHLTARENIPRLVRIRLLQSAAALAASARRTDLLTQRRRQHVEIVVGGETVILRDQAPLHLGNMRLDSEWSYERFVRHINERVFFWPGGPSGPIAYGVRHFSRYEEERPVILRIGFEQLLEANPGRLPLFAKCNSGSPRWSRGIAAARGESTFVCASDVTFRPSQVIEVTFERELRIPDDAELADRPTGPWTRAW